MNNQSNSDYDKDLSWSENPDNFPFDADAQEGGNKKDVFTTLIKTFSMMILALALLVFVGIAWFTMNKNVGTMSPFVLKTLKRFWRLTAVYSQPWIHMKTQTICCPKKEKIFR